jgi:hypothetical protein
MGFYYAVFYAIIILRFSLGGHMKKTFFVLMMMTFVIFLLACKDNKETQEKVLFNLVATKDDNYGVINQDGEEVLPFTYKELSTPSKDGVMVHRYQNGLYQLINLEGEVIASSFSDLEPIYDQSIKGYTHRTPYAFYGVKNSKASLYDSKGEHFMDTDLFVGVYNQKIYLMQKGYFSLNDVSKELVKEYESIYQLSDDAYFTLKESTTYILDSNGDIEREFPNSTMVVMQNFVKITSGSLKYLFDFYGNEFNNYSYHEAYQIQGTDYILIRKNEKFGVIDLEGNFIVPFDYADIDYKNNLFIAKMKTGFNTNHYIFYIYNKDTLLKTLHKYASGRCYGYGNGVYVTYLYHLDAALHNLVSEGCYYFNEDNMVGGPYKNALPFNEKGFAAIETELGVKGIINDEFELVDSSYRTYEPFGNYFLVQSKEEDNMYQWGILDHNLDLVVPVKYELLFNYLFPFKNLIALLDEETMITHYYVIDDEGKLQYLYDLSFEDAVSYFYELVDYSYEDDYIGNLIKIRSEDLPEGYEIKDIIAKDYMITTKDGKYGVIDQNYDIVIPFEYDMIKGNEGIE